MPVNAISNFNINALYFGYQYIKATIHKYKVDISPFLPNIHKIVPTKL